MIWRILAAGALFAICLAVAVWMMAWLGNIAPADFALSWLLAMVAVFMLALVALLEGRRAA